MTRAVLASPFNLASPGHRSRRAALALSALLVLAILPASHTFALRSSSSPLALAPRATAAHPASLGFSKPLAGAPFANAPNPNYDEQLGVTFTQDLSSLSYNVSALAQTDSNGYGPAYILNGLTAAGYWYQVGISYHWPAEGGGYNTGFAFSYEVFGPDGGAVYPSQGSGLGTFSGPVHSGDSVLLSLTFFGSSVSMVAEDWATGASARESYLSFGATTFVGDRSSPSNSHGFFTGVMTEWYHVSPYSGNEGKVTYTNTDTAISSAWFWIDEFNPSSSGPPIFYNETQSPVAFASPEQFYPFSSNGATMYGSAHQFITGQLNAASSRILLTPATTTSALPTFTADYTLSGLPQASSISAGQSTTVEADPGTTITVGVNASSIPSGSMWAFSGVSNSATFDAGTNVTYVFYQIVEEHVSYQVAPGGSPLPSSAVPELIYDLPPSQPSATPAAAAFHQALGATPVVIFAVLGSTASLNGSIAATDGHRWAANPQGWAISGPDSIPDPIPIYEQFQVSVGYSVAGGGSLLYPPDFLANAFGSQVSIPISDRNSTGWFDTGSRFSFTQVINGSSSGERWLAAPAVQSPSPTPNAMAFVINQEQTISETYNHQYLATLGANDAAGGNLSRESGWINAGGNLNVTASANPQWEFASWTGSGDGAYSGTNPSISILVNAPLAENATFFVQLTLSADSRTDVAYSFNPEDAASCAFLKVIFGSCGVSGSVQPGTSKAIFVPPGSNVTLSGSPSLFLYSFASWQGSGLTSTGHSIGVVVDSPTNVTANSTYNYPVVLSTAGISVIVLLGAASLWIRRRRESSWRGGFYPT